MDRLVYDKDNKKIICRIADCEGTSTGTPFEMVEDTPENIDKLIDLLELVYPESSFDRN